MLNSELTWTTARMCTVLNRYLEMLTDWQTDLTIHRVCSERSPEELSNLIVISEGLGFVLGEVRVRKFLDSSQMSVSFSLEFHERHLVEFKVWKQSFIRNIFDSFFYISHEYNFKYQRFSFVQFSSLSAACNCNKSLRLVFVFDGCSSSHVARSEVIIRPDRVVCCVVQAESSTKIVLNK